MLHNFEIVLLNYQKCSKLRILLLTLITLIVHAHHDSIPLPATAMQSTYDGIIDPELFKYFQPCHYKGQAKMFIEFAHVFKVTCHCYAVFIKAWKSELM